ncbi:hypothetical protein B0A50_03630 [Salinomyces thailandicus]|uniref:tRNA dimethylallyltransferase n=1 Tax=Salinomyces thailandicus TaxID=706561 RepID=A0A4U0U2C3_9PEZI|nr:hypothetical protein B0A50_03630 [Salinomyces thailandica]
MARTPPSSPLIAVIGATGTGKSQLAIALAQRYNGEIINGDAMQLYSGLPVITNKITFEEQQGVPHHLLGCIGLREQTWVVGTFVRNALKSIDEIRSRGKLPILVGGTHYYTQSLLFHDRLAEAQDGEGKELQHADEEYEDCPILQQSTETLLEELKKVDPVMAERWHPRDRRKIQRSLQIYLKTGEQASRVYAEQRQRKPAFTNGNAEHKVSVTRSPMRFPTLLFWVHAETRALQERLDRRVDKMLDSGLLNEVRMLNAHAEAENLAGRSIDETRGIWVSIGYKEFKSYMTALESGSATTKELERLQAEALDRTKAATRQYAKRQVRWIRIKLVHALNEVDAASSLYILDGSDASAFDSAVIQPAATLAEDFLNGSALPSPEAAAPPSLAELLKPKREYDVSARPETWTKQHCEICDVTCVVQEQWQQHVNSKAHKKLVSKRRKQAADGSK